MYKVALLATMIAITMTKTFASSPNFQVWIADPLIKVMQNTTPPANPPSQIQVNAVRNEYESAQIVITPTANISTLTVSISPISGPAGSRPQVTTNFVGYVPVYHGTPYTPSDNLVAVAPDPSKPNEPVYFPDPLLDSTSVSVTYPKNQPIWLTIRVPTDTQPGTYTGTVTVTGDGASISVPLAITVSSFALPSNRTFKFTNWLNYDNLADYYGLSMWSTSYWNMISNIAQFSAKYRMNVTLTRLNRLVVCHTDNTDPAVVGNLTFDFSRFDKWVDIFKSAGAMDVIEGGHLCGKSYDGTDYYVWFPEIRNPDNTKKTMNKTMATSAQAINYYSQFLPALKQHLIDKGWLGSYIQHIGDEPLSQSAASYRNVASIVHQYAPGIKIVDAIETTNLVGAIDTWVPQPQNFNSNMAFYNQRKSLGEEVWLYTCLTPKGEYMNRFVDYPLIDVRLIHWENFKYGLPGYLHWGLNYWHGDSFTNIESNYGSTTTAFSPPGDSHIVYKSSTGFLSSIRLEALRDGIEDYELLKLLEKKDSTRAHQICDTIVRSLTDYTRDPAAFRIQRTQLVSSLLANKISVEQVKSLPAGSEAFLSSGVVTADFRTPSSNLGLFYIENENRTSGIGVKVSGSAEYTPGQLTDIYGHTSLLDGTELIIMPDAIFPSPGTALKPLALNNKATGGGAFYDQPAIIDNALAQPQPKKSSGINSIGKLIKTWGIVTGSAQTSYGTIFWINDGSNLRDGFMTSQNTYSLGLAVLLPPTMTNIPNGHVRAIGIIRSIPNPAGLPVRLLVPRSNTDIGVTHIQ